MHRITRAHAAHELLTAFLLVVALPQSWALSSLSPAEAIDHVGERASVCGTVASANYATGSNGQPTFLNLDRPYPTHVFTALIWGEDRSKFPYPPESLEGESICVQGLIESYKGTAEIVVDDPSQIIIQ